MRYHIMGSGQDGVTALKRDTMAGAIKKADELRRDGYYHDVRIFDTATGAEVEERAAPTTH